MIIAEVLEELKKREPIFHRKEFGRTRSDFENMMDKDFWEVGASGNIYTKNYVLDILEDRYNKHYEEIWKTKNFKCIALSEGVYLLTYTLIQDNNRVTQRSTIWKYEGYQDWKIVYHQGTIVREKNESR